MIFGPFIVSAIIVVRTVFTAVQDVPLLVDLKMPLNDAA
jgi:hypothetical protein